MRGIALLVREPNAHVLQIAQRRRGNMRLAQRAGRIRRRFGEHGSQARDRRFEGLRGIAHQRIRTSRKRAARIGDVELARELLQLHKLGHRRARDEQARLVQQQAQLPAHATAQRLEGRGQRDLARRAMVPHLIEHACLLIEREQGARGIERFGRLVDTRAGGTGEAATDRIGGGLATGPRALQPR